MIATIILISLFVIVPPIYNHKQCKLAHYNVDGRWYGREYSTSNKIFNSFPIISIAVSIQFLSIGWRY